MTRFLLAGATAFLALAAAPSAHAVLCGDPNLVRSCRAMVGERVCGTGGEKCGIYRCYYPSAATPVCLY